MIRISGVTLDPKKQVRFALTPIRGIGKSNVKSLLEELKIEPATKLGDLNDDQIKSIRTYIEENLTVEEDLSREKKSNIKRLIDIKCYRGMRHKAGLPVRGQTTKTNSRTCRGNKRFTAGSGRAKSAQKT